MPRDDEYEDGDRPRRRRPRDDEDEDRPARSRWRGDDDLDVDRPHRRRSFEDADRPPVEWIRPDDIEWLPGRAPPLLGGTAPELPFCAVLMLDGSVRRMDKNVNENTLRHLIDRQDGNVIPPGWER